MDQYGKWEVVKPLDHGGQGKVYIVRDTEQAGETRRLRSQLHNSINQLKIIATAKDHDLAGIDLINTLSSLMNFNVQLGALKVLHIPKDGEGYDKAVGRLKQEIDALQSLNHPNVLKILDHNINEKWFVGEYHARGSLWQNKSLFMGNMFAALTAFRPLVHAVAALHKANLVHRDIKPHNVFIAADGRLVLGDFGIVLLNNAIRTRLTDTYENVGSRDWMPAWAFGRRIEDITPSFDVFCLGKLFWAMLSGSSMLPLWYHHERAYEVEELFPDSDSIKWARRILDHCIVEKEYQCLPSASELLREVDVVLTALKRHGQVVADGVNRSCNVCGLGRYELTVDEEYASVLRFGLAPNKPDSSFKIFTCSNCGHVELFHIGNVHSKPPAWRKS